MWFSARLIYKSIHYWNQRKIPRRRPMFEEVILLLKARNQEHAFKRACQLGKKNEHKYQNKIGEVVYWKLMQLIEVQEIDQPPKNGAEISSRFFTNMSAFKKLDSLVK